MAHTQAHKYVGAKSRLNNEALTPKTRMESSHDDADDSSSSSISSTGTLKPTPRQTSDDSSALPKWLDYFEQELYLEMQTDAQYAKYHVYLTAPSSPSQGPLFITHHGAGSSGLSFALFAAAIRKLVPDAGILSVNARDHGSTVCNASGEASRDFSLELLAEDFVEMVRLTQTRMGWEHLPPFVLVGHSLGGAVVTDVAKKGVLGAKIVGYAVLDVVEGSAVEALRFMQAYISSRPSSFSTVESAIEWHVRSRTLRNIESARISVPSLLQQMPSGAWTWRTNLAMTQEYWQNWFGGMSAKFLSAQGAKLLLLAGTDRLDKELMVGQMQGKFQLAVFPEAGHVVQEDVPEKTAELIAEFFKRNDRTKLVLPPKVSELLAQGKKI